VTDTSFWWIVGGGLLMSAIALTGSLTALLSDRAMQRLIRPLIALAAGSLLGGALFHLIPAGRDLGDLTAAVWIFTGFTAFLCLEQLLHWRHCHHPDASRDQPVTLLILAADGLHNFLGGLGVAGTFLINPQAGISAWIAAAAHEIPQELGDFGVLIHGGWNRRRALAWNFASGLTFLAGGLVAWTLSLQFDVTPLVLLGAGNFIYISASDLIPEIKTGSSLSGNLVSLACFVAGALVLLALAMAEG
jgi:zinc and cadmium transporter